MFQLQNRTCDVCGKKTTVDGQIICEYCGNEFIAIKNGELMGDEEEKKEVIKKRANKSILYGFEQVHPFDAELKEDKTKENETKIPFEIPQIQPYEAEILQLIETQINKQFTYINNFENDTKLGYMVKNNEVIGISIYNCKIKALPESMGELKSIESLYLRSNQLKTFPTRIINLKSLKELSLSDNQLISLPEAIESLTSLQKLDISYNRLTIIPETIGNITSLQELNLRVNQLKSLPESIRNLSSLQKLDLSHNKFLSLPESLQHLLKLKNLLISGNIFLNQMDRKTKNVIKVLNQKDVSITK